jgi:hypothetical protein
VSKSIRVPTPIRLEPLTLIVQIDRVDVYVHWTVFAIAALILVNAVHRPVLALVGGVCYMGMLFIHEWGHVIAAHKRGSKVLSVKLYPIFGLTQFETPWSRFDHCVIAWGGVLAQMVVALPFPFPPLDGATAWGIIPVAIQRARANRNPRPSNWRGRR